jgi:serine/threonine protein kinase
VQEWCGLGTLNAKIAKKELLSSLNFEEVIEVCAEISSAASYLHSRGIIHGDLTASNVLLAERCVPKGYTAKVTDFGLARILDSGASKIDTATMGTVTYMPPELFQLEGSCLTKKVDVYAFGVIMWQMCTGRPPFENLLPTQVVVMVASGATLELPVHVPPALAQVHKQCMSREPEERPEFDRIIQSMLKMMKLDSTTMPSRGMRRFSRRD